MNKTYIANENHGFLKKGTKVYQDYRVFNFDPTGQEETYCRLHGDYVPPCQPDWYDEVKWKPKEGEEYYYVRDCEFNKDLVVRRTEWECTDWDERKYRIGNCYKTREEAGQALERVLKAYKGE